MFASPYLELETASGKVGYCRVGESGPDLVMLVGYSGTLYHWNKFFIAELAKSFCIYLVDNRLIGLSDSLNEYSMNGMAADVADFIQAAGLHRPLVFGWSMGGMIAQTLAKNYPDLVSGMVLLVSIPHGSYTTSEFVNLVANSAHLPASEFRTQLYAMFFSESPRAELKEFITSSALSIEGYHYRFTFEAKELQDYAVMAWHGMDEESLAALKVPVLILRARDDLVVEPRAGEFFLQHIPNAKMITFPRGGHFFLHHNPVAIARDVCNFFLNA